MSRRDLGRPSCTGAFLIVFNTALLSPANDIITLPFSFDPIYNPVGQPGEVLDFTVDWGDGTAPESFSGTDPLTIVSHDYSSSQAYLTKSSLVEIAITGTVERFNFQTVLSSSKEAFIDVLNWRSAALGQFGYWFKDCVNLQGFTDPDTPVNSVSSGLVTLRGMFYGCSSLLSEGFDTWDIQLVTDLHETFRGASSVTGVGISAWNTVSVTSLFNTFHSCVALTDSLGAWDVAQVTNMFQTFFASTTGDLDLANWDTQQVTALDSTFKSCPGLIGASLGSWDVSGRPIYIDINIHISMKKNIN